MRDLSVILKLILKREGASLVGFANVSHLQDDFSCAYPYAISLGVALNAQILAKMKEVEETSYRNEFVKVNSQLTQLAALAVQVLKDRGYNGVSVPVTKEDISPDKLDADFSHKAASLAGGMGWLGKSGLLITEEFGSALRLITVLTDAELENTDSCESEKPGCGSCNECVAFCPAGAIRGESWNPEMPGKNLFAAALCYNKMQKEQVSCGICITVCPWTIQYAEGKGIYYHHEKK